VERDDLAMTHDPLSLTRKLLAFNTINPPGNERDCAEFLGGLLENAGFDARYYEFADKRAMLIGRLVGGGDKLPICFYGSFGYGSAGRHCVEARCVCRRD
jgi:succinyl-diaminopimelate desuccinylase